MASASDASLLGGETALSAAAAAIGSSYAVTLLSAPDDIASVIGEAAHKLPFQNPAWIKPLMATIGKARNASALAVVVRDAKTDQLALVLPLALTREQGCTTASYPDFGVSDYGAPVLGLAAPSTLAEANAVWRSVRRALTGVDLIRLQSMPACIGGRPNPLAVCDASQASRHHAHSVHVDGTVEDFLRSRGKKFRKEVERCFRLLHAEGPVQFERATNAASIDAAYLELEQQQSDRRKAAGSGYVLDDPAYSAFYRQVIESGTPKETAHLFKLSAGGTTVATLFGVTEGTTFTLLRIANGGERWRSLSPGRLVVVEAMRYFVARGIRTFDMGIGDYAFKRGFGADPQPLSDLVAARTWRAFVPVAVYRLKAAARRSPELQAAARFVRDAVRPSDDD